MCCAFFLPTHAAYKYFLCNVQLIVLLLHCQDDDPYDDDLEDDHMTATRAVEAAGEDAWSEASGARRLLSESWEDTGEDEYDAGDDADEFEFASDDEAAAASADDAGAMDQMQQAKQHFAQCVKARSGGQCKSP